MIIHTYTIYIYIYIHTYICIKSLAADVDEEVGQGQVPSGVHK